MLGNIVRCQCGKLYEIYSMYVGSQNVCPACRAEVQAEYQRQRGDSTLPSADIEGYVESMLKKRGNND